MRIVQLSGAAGFRLHRLENGGSDGIQWNLPIQGLEQSIFVGLYIDNMQMGIFNYF